MLVLFFVSIVCYVLVHVGTVHLLVHFGTVLSSFFVGIVYLLVQVDTLWYIMYSVIYDKKNPLNEKVMH